MADVLRVAAHQPSHPVVLAVAFERGDGAPHEAMTEPVAALKLVPGADSAALTDGL